MSYDLEPGTSGQTEANFDSLNLTMAHNSILQGPENILRMKQGVQMELEPWYTAFLNMSGDPRASNTYQMEGPMSYVTRNNTGPEPGKVEIASDSVASLLNALM